MAGDEEQIRLGKLYELEYGRMVRMAQRSLPADEGAYAEDLVQTVFMEAVRVSLGSRSLILGRRWLVRRLRSRIADRYRRRARQPRAEALEEGDEHGTHVPAAEPAPSPEEQVLKIDYLHELLSTIADPVDRAALVLKVQGFSEAEIATRLSLAYEARAVRDRLVRVRRRARQRRNAIDAENS